MYPWAKKSLQLYRFIVHICYISLTLAISWTTIHTYEANIFGSALCCTILQVCLIDELPEIHFASNRTVCQHTVVPL